MSVVSSNPLTASASVDAENNRNYSVVYQVIVSDAANDGPRVAAAGTGLSLSSSYSFGSESDAGAYFDRYSSSKPSGTDQEGRLIYHVVAEFTTAEKRTCDQNQIDDPTQLPEEKSGSFVQFQKNIQKDANGDPIVNTAGTPFFDVTRDDSRPSLVIKKNFNSIDLSQFVEYADAINGDFFYGLPKRVWKVQRIEWSQAFRGSCAPYYPVTFEFQANFDTWDEEKASIGFYEKDGNNIKLILDDSTPPLPIQEPVPLDKLGAKLAAGDPIVYVTIEKYKEKPFSALGIDTSL